MTDPLRPGDPTELGGYHLIGRLGQGGMGAVYLGRGAGGRLVAVKVIRPEYAAEAEFRGRFRSEVNRARQVPPFCTAEVLDADPDHATPYLVVEYVDGPSLAQVISRSGPLAAGSLHSVAVGVATALAAIHGAGVIHRDLKPANVLFALGTPKVIDFGIARAFEVTSQHTRTDQMVGTVAYMAPERFDTDHGGTTVSPAADVFAWGAVVTYAGTGRTPFHADSAAATAARILTQPPDLSGLPAALRPVVERTLAKDPRDRPTAQELLDLLLVPDLDEETRLVPAEVLRAAEAAQRSEPRPRRRRAALATLAGLAGLALGAGALVATGTVDRTAFGQGGGGAAAAPGPAGSPAPAGPRRRTVPGTSIIDRLDRPGQWFASRGNGGRCAFTGGRLTVTTDSVHRCRGPADTFAGDQSVAVDVSIVSAGACALIWFRSTADGAYRVAVCEKDIRFGVETPADLTGETRTPVAGTAPGRVRRIGIDVRDERATVTVDGAPVLATALGEPSLAAGRVELGAMIDDTGDRVTFANAEVRSR
ncbi:protein kinase domain-containing protein [Actinoplanes teichomyceticus]|uniref:protein kinase domain-containing protein n=1 Tax=Actinoplanes teichomyceticus TaxID=1867 RepID=UPI000F09D4E1|nr:serine/threonine-protein kinase [Actinoplanes teichomyceticus]